MKKRTNGMVSLLSLISVTAALCLRVSHCPIRASSTRQRQRTLANGKNENSAEDLSINLSEISDAETLLACRSYLQRKNKLGWKEFERRKEMHQQSSAIISSYAKESVGYFWEDPSELLCVHNDDVDGDRPSYGDVYPEGPNVLQQLHVDQVVFEETGVSDESVSSGGGGVFTTYPTGPSEARIRRSKAKSAQWQDPDFRRRWYAKRWANKTILTEAVKKERRQDKKLLAMPAKILDSDEMAAMSEEEVQEAIVTYVTSNRRRGNSMKVRGKQYVETKTEQRLTRDVLFTPDIGAMEEKQRLRSERAKAAYQKRLENQGSLPLSPKRSKIQLPRGMSPREALLRVSADLELQRLPTLQDVTIILTPTKLGRRKDLLRRILNEHFDLRGKCVPVELDNPGGDLLFVTQAPLAQLGNFVLRQMKEALI